LQLLPLTGQVFLQHGFNLIGTPVPLQPIGPYLELIGHDEHRCGAKAADVRLDHLRLTIEPVGAVDGRRAGAALFVRRRLRLAAAGLGVLPQKDASGQVAGDLASKWPGYVVVAGGGQVAAPSCRRR
jgi:hypothetical protein